MKDEVPLDPEVRKRIVNDALKSSGFLAKHGPQKLEPTTEVILRAEDVKNKVWKLVEQVLRVDHAAKGQYHRGSCYDLCLKLCKDEFLHWSKDDLHYVLSVILAEYLLDKADALVEQLL